MEEVVFHCVSIAEAQQQQLIYDSKSKPRYFMHSFQALAKPVCWNVPLQE